MTAPIIQAHYEQLELIANNFRAQQERVATHQQAVQRSYQPLEQGGWQGKGSQAFTSEMEQVVFPALNRLHHALGEGEATVRQIIAIMRAAEQEASQPFRNGADDAVGISNASGAAGVSYTADNAARDGIVRPVVDVNSLFAPEKMKQMVGKTWQGEGSEQLRNAMNVLNGNPTPEQERKALDDIAAARGVDRGKIQQDYETFKQMRGQMVNEHGQLDPTSASLLPFVHDDYMGSRGQLRFGQIIGEAFGIDPVFGALLEPTGGMPGAGKWAISTNDSILSYHAAHHDAAGFLHTRFDQGPGYDYLNQESHRPTDHGLTGQESGLKFWSGVMLQRDAQAVINDPWNPVTHLKLMGRGAESLTSITGGVGLGEFSDFARSNAGKVTFTVLKYTPPGIVARKGIDLFQRALE